MSDSRPAGAHLRDESIGTVSTDPDSGSAARRSVRLDGELLERAGEASRIAHRSVPHQIEFWAALGRAVEERLSAADTRDLLSGERFVTRVECASSRSFDPEQVFAALEADRASGALAARVSGSPARYDIADASVGLVRRVEADGSESFGRFENGIWRAQDAGG